MLFELLSVENLGVFRGSHTINLAPPDSSRPIVLVGALNGSGKTTIIEALQLALYGRRAGYGWRGVESYSQYLEQLRNRYALTSEPTRVELTVRLTDGRRLRIRRQWSFHKGVPKEFLDVFKDDASVPDSELTEGWDDEIERLLPAKLSELFFFDGERLELLADPKKSASVLRSAISSLLGIDLVDSLLSDLEVVRQRQRRKYLTDSDRANLDALDADLQRVTEELTLVRQELSQYEARRDHAKSRLAGADDGLRSQGHDRLREKEALIAQRAALQAEITAGEDALRELAAGSLPFAVATPFLMRLRDSIAQRGDLFQSADLELLRRHTDSFKRWLGSRRFAAATKREIVTYLDKSLTEPSGSGKAAVSVDYRAALGRVNQLLGVSLPEVRSRTAELVKHVASCRRRLDATERKIARLPVQEHLTEIIKEQVAAEAALEAINKEFDLLEHKSRLLMRQRDQLERQKSKYFERTLESGDAERVVAYCQRAKESLEVFRTELVRQRRELLETLVLEAFQLLTRKTDLASGLTIDADTMHARLLGPDGHTIHTEQLSAGERQLLAVAMLWGLAKASGRPVPVVIDTPLGRLDGEHRSALVQRYFPDASHQVILLSTDEEVDASFSASLDDVVAHRYLIVYDAGTKSSKISAGYFQG